METLTNLVKNINGYLWDYILVFLLCGTGIYFTFKLKFIQVRKFGESFKKTFGGISFGKKSEDGMTSFQALATAISAQVGTGNLAGAATAIVSGGPGAIFWMWVSAFFGMSTIFAEATLAQVYKTEKDGEPIGGPAYYISKGLNNKFLAGFFSVSIIIALGFVGNLVQANSIGAAFNKAFNVNPYIVGAILAVLALLIFVGGMSRIASFAEKVVPIMALFYIIGSLFILVTNATNILPAFKAIFVGAFKPSAVAGGVIGVTVKNAIRYGVSRGLFSNEAGMGSTPHAHAVADVKHPCDQGLVAIMGVFIDTFIILTLTALVILTTEPTLTGKMTGIALTQHAFTTGMGAFGEKFIAISLFFFAFSTIIGWYFFGATNIKFLFGKKAMPVYQVLVMICIVIGCGLKVEFVWQLADLFNGIMVFPNLIAILALSKIVKTKLTEYEALDITKDY
ncbi:alanine or glycine:cation symporter, AGCS family [Hathewaya proteolytica DSM 3090]|uniref:Alanine or glycine:cation symporter, AGCS family n=1 Tax=Hathewaya proteolytica DSM 3090 TaxID=1121331 RepID=A0A1M6MFZ5_9CLOT|nr:sodium:alanine symporter family protein [Hathewaya proteolytica]SHJ82296.1 alanine or glycine:cation symporter, AGCS family [Hathewaya proteolytica DSM 3090]